MAGNIACNLIAAALDGFSFTLLIPFLNALFDLPPHSDRADWVTQFLQFTIGGAGRQRRQLGSLRNVILILLAIVAVKNVFVWLAGTLGARCRSTSRATCATPCSAICSAPARLLPAHEDRADHLARAHRHRADEGAHHPARHAGDLRSRDGDDLRRLSVRHLVAADVHRARRRAALTFALQPLLRKLRHGYRRLRNDYGEMTSVLQESVSGVRLVKSFGAEAYEDSRFIGASHRYSHGLVRIAQFALSASRSPRCSAPPSRADPLDRRAKWVLGRRHDAGVASSRS